MASLPMGHRKGKKRKGILLCAVNEVANKKAAKS